eukprot:gene10341-12696_t
MNSISNKFKIKKKKDSTSDLNLDNNYNDKNDFNLPNYDPTYKDLNSSNNKDTKNNNNKDHQQHQQLNDRFTTTKTLNNRGGFNFKNDDIVLDDDDNDSTPVLSKNNINKDDDVDDGDDDFIDNTNNNKNIVNNSSRINSPLKSKKYTYALHNQDRNFDIFVNNNSNNSFVNNSNQTTTRSSNIEKFKSLSTKVVDYQHSSHHQDKDINKQTPSFGWEQYQSQLQQQHNVQTPSNSINNIDNSNTFQNFKQKLVSPHKLKSNNVNSISNTTNNNNFNIFSTPPKQQQQRHIFKDSPNTTGSIGSGGKAKLSLFESPYKPAKSNITNDNINSIGSSGFNNNDDQILDDFIEPTIPVNSIMEKKRKDHDNIDTEYYYNDQHVIDDITSSPVTPTQDLGIDNNRRFNYTRNNNNTNNSTTTNILTTYNNEIAIFSSQLSSQNIPSTNNNNNDTNPFANGYPFLKRGDSFQNDIKYLGNRLLRSDSNHSIQQQIDFIESTQQQSQSQYQQQQQPPQSQQHQKFTITQHQQQIFQSQNKFRSTQQQISGTQDISSSAKFHFTPVIRGSSQIKSFDFYKKDVPSQTDDIMTVDDVDNNNNNNINQRVRLVDTIKNSIDGENIDQLPQQQQQQQPPGQIQQSYSPPPPIFKDNARRSPNSKRYIYLDEIDEYPDQSPPWKSNNVLLDDDIPVDDDYDSSNNNQNNINFLDSLKDYNSSQQDDDDDDYSNNNNNSNNNNLQSQFEMESSAQTPKFTKSKWLGELSENLMYANHHQSLTKPIKTLKITKRFDRGGLAEKLVKQLNKQKFNYELISKRVSTQNLALVNPIPNHSIRELVIRIIQIPSPLQPHVYVTQCLCMNWIDIENDPVMISNNNNKNNNPTTTNNLVQQFELQQNNNNDSNGSISLDDEDEELNNQSKIGGEPKKQILTVLFSFGMKSQYKLGMGSTVVVEYWQCIESGTHPTIICHIGHPLSIPTTNTSTTTTTTTTTTTPVTDKDISEKFSKISITDPILKLPGDIPQTLPNICTTIIPIDDNNNINNQQRLVDELLLNIEITPLEEVNQNLIDINIHAVLLQCFPRNVNHQYNTKNPPQINNQKNITTCNHKKILDWKERSKQRLLSKHRNQMNEPGWIDAISIYVANLSGSIAEIQIPYTLVEKWKTILDNQVFCECIFTDLLFISNSNVSRASQYGSFLSHYVPESFQPTQLNVSVLRAKSTSSFHVKPTPNPSFSQHYNPITPTNITATLNSMVNFSYWNRISVRGTIANIKPSQNLNHQINNYIYKRNGFILFLVDNNNEQQPSTPLLNDNNNNNNNQPIGLNIGIKIENQQHFYKHFKVGDTLLIQHCVIQQEQIPIGVLLLADQYSIIEKIDDGVNQQSPPQQPEQTEFCDLSVAITTNPLIQHYQFISKVQGVVVDLGSSEFFYRGCVNCHFPVQPFKNIENILGYQYYQQEGFFCPKCRLLVDSQIMVELNLLVQLFNQTNENDQTDNESSGILINLIDHRYHWNMD